MDKSDLDFAKQVELDLLHAGYSPHIVNASKALKILRQEVLRLYSINKGIIEACKVEADKLNCKLKKAKKKIKKLKGKPDAN